jgi:hypothetical protein
MTEAVLSIFWKMVRRTAVGHAPALPPIFLRHKQSAVG